MGIIKFGLIFGVLVSWIWVWQVINKLVKGLLVTFNIKKLQGVYDYLRKLRTNKSKMKVIQSVFAAVIVLPYFLLKTESFF